MSVYFSNLVLKRSNCFRTFTILYLLSLDHMTGGIYLILCLQWVVVYILGIKK